MNAPTLLDPRCDATPDRLPAADKQDQPRNERRLDRYLTIFTWVVIAAAFAVRFFTAYGTYFNPDEALHYELIHEPSLALAYRHAMTNAHPPLFYIVLYFWQFLGRSEWMMRMPSVIAGTAFCWFFFRWMEAMWGKKAAIPGLVIAAFCPALLTVSAEVRNYSLMLAGMAAALYFLERAFRERSAGWMACFSVSLYVAMLSHYSAVFFTCAVGLYSLMRMADARPPRKLLFTWAGGQAVALAIYAFLYATHISKVGASIETWEQPFYRAYFHAQDTSLADFTITQTSDVFGYLFQQSYVSRLMLFVFLAGIVFLFVRGLLRRADQSGMRHQALLLLLPFALVWGAAVYGAYPYVGSRHTVVLAPFAIAAASIVFAQIIRDRLWIGIAAAGALMVASNVFAGPPPPYIARADQQLDRMAAAVKDVQQAPATDTIFMDLQSRIVLPYYLCGSQSMTPWDESSHPGFATRTCGGRSMVALDYSVWKFTPGNFAAQFAGMARSFGLKQGDRVRVFQTGWGANLDVTLPQFYPKYLCVAPHKFGANISIVPFVVAEDFSPAVPDPACRK